MVPKWTRISQTWTDNKETKDTQSMACVHSIKGHVLCCCGAVTQITKVLETQWDSLVAQVCSCTKTIMLLECDTSVYSEVHRVARKGHTVSDSKLVKIVPWRSPLLSAEEGWVSPWNARSRALRSINSPVRYCCYLVLHQRDRERRDPFLWDFFHFSNTITSFLKTFD